MYQKAQDHLLFAISLSIHFNHSFFSSLFSFLLIGYAILENEEKIQQQKDNNVMPFVWIFIINLTAFVGHF